MDVRDHGTPGRDFDHWLDEALHARNDAEPRMGLEDRVLARLASEPQQKSFFIWPALTAFAALMVIASALLVLHQRPSRTSTAHELPAGKPQLTNEAPVQRLGSPSMSAAVRRAPRTRQVASCCLVAKERADAQGVLPKLARFPSARPQTAQERMLMRLAARRDSYETAALEAHPEFGEVSVPELKVDRMAGTPPDDHPQR
jgi:hypothetical protein